ncbi:MAG: hypothetical protein FJ296_09180 [Planctomycetes bacterium]|nr:hypothetical protein [Planctomycetota bacterium]
MSLVRAPTAATSRATEGAVPRSALLALAAAGGLTFLAGLFLAPDRVWGGFLTGFAWLASVAIAGPASIALLSLAGARWWVALRRVPESMAATLPAVAVAGLCLPLGLHALYEWSHPGVVDADPLLARKAAWLDGTFFSLRLVAILALWLLATRFLLARSRRFAAEGGDDARRALVRASALFMAVFAPTFSVAAFDWLMSLEPHWFSTMFALQHAGGAMAAGTAAAVLLALRAEREGRLSGLLRDEHLHDLGKLLFAFTLFWGYCWFCQYMLIWYTDIPEETAHYVARRQGPWWLLVQASLALKWGVPFLALLARRACRSRVTLARVAVCVLAGHALDLYVQVGPPLMGDTPRFGAWEILPLAGAVALFFWLSSGALARTAAEPVDHPHLHDSLTYRTP